MKKRYYRGLLLLLAFSLLLPLFWTDRVIANETEEVQTIIDYSNLTVKVSVQEKEDTLDWQIHYWLKSDDDLKRLKYSFAANDQLVSFEEADGWSQQGDWFVEHDFSEETEGVISLVTASDIRQASLRIQADAEVLNDDGETALLTDIFSEQFEGPYDLELPGAEEESEDEQDSNHLELPGAEEESEDEQDSNDLELPKSEEESEDENEEKSAVTSLPQSATKSNFAQPRGVTTLSLDAGYVEDDTGEYPKDYWIPGNDENVRNYPGDDGKEAWDGDPANLEDSYLGYMDDDQEVADLRKYAKETDTPGLFDVYLNIRGYSKTVTTDVVFVNDLSGSMNQDIYGNIKGTSNYKGDSKIKLQNDAMRTMLEALKDEDKLNVGFVGYSSYFDKEDIGGSQIKGKDNYRGDNKIISMLPVKDAATEIVNYLSPLDAGVKEEGGTFTQKALLDAEALLNGSTAERKLIILMTDGQPSVSYPVTSVVQLPAGSFNDTVITKGAIAAPHAYNIIKTPVPSGATFPNVLEMPMTAGGSTGFWYNWTQTSSPGYSSNQSYYVNGVRINSPWHALIGTARDIMNTGIEIYGMGMNITEKFTGINDEGIELKLADVENAFRDITSGTDHYYPVNTAEQLQAFVRSIVEALTSKTIINANLTDPLGEYYTYESPPEGLKVISVGKIDVPEADLPTVTYDAITNMITATDISLGEDQEIQIHYQLRINTEADDFKTDYWYPMNGRTVLNVPDPEDPDNPSELDFGVPSGKAPGVKIDLKKIWEEYDEDTSLRPQYLYFEVERETPTSGWSKAYLRLSAADNWERKDVDKLSAAFGDDDYAETLYLPSFNNLGQSFTYKVVAEVNLPDAYEFSSSGDGSVWTNSKIFVPYELLIMKFSDQGEAIGLSGAVFQLARVEEDGSLLDPVNLIPGTETGSYILPEGDQYKLQLNSSYILTEITAPLGYETPASSWTLTVNAKGEVSIEGEEALLRDGIIYYEIENQFIERLLLAEKYNLADSSLLEGAKFTLKKHDEDWEGDGVIVGSENDLIGNDAESYKNLTPGYYSLEETTVPDGFAKDKTVYKFIIDINGRLLDEDGNEIVSADKPETDGFYLKEDDGVQKIIFAKYNALLPFDLTIIKKDAHSGKALSGVEFSLRDSPDGPVLATLVTAGDGGSGIFLDANNDVYLLSAGTYYINETKTVDGYVLLKETFIVTISDSAEVTVSYGESPVGDDLIDVSLALDADDNNSIVLTVDNTPKGLLPATGGRGNSTFLYLAAPIFGLALIVAVYYFIRNNRNRFSFKWLKVLAILFAVISILGLSNGYIFADNNSAIDVTVHKRLFADEVENPLQNTGQEMDFAGEPLAGAEFQVFELTDSYYELLKSLTEEEAMEELQKQYMDTVTGVPLATAVTDANGEASFKLAGKAGGRDAVYVFVETKLPADLIITKKAAPIVIVLPLYALDFEGNFTDEILEDVHLYPKNVGYEPEPEPSEPEPTETEKTVPTTKAEIPPTGEGRSVLTLMGIILIALAIVLLGGLVIYTRRRKLLG